MIRMRGLILQYLSKLLRNSDLISACNGYVRRIFHVRYTRRGEKNFMPNKGRHQSPAGAAVGMATRRVITGTSALHYCDNSISTRHYSWWTFLPVSLLFQFRKLSNCYFLASAVIMLIPNISPLTPFSAIGPLVFIVAVSEIREFLEEVGAGRRDRKANQALVDKLTDRVATSSLHPGDLVIVRDNQQLPADIVLLGSSAKDGTGFVETANLDGETNLKLRRSPALTSSLPLPDLYGLRVTFDPPNADMYSFRGLIEKIESATPTASEALTTNHLLLRGTTLRNTEWAVGVVVYSGNDAKMLLNARSGLLTSKTTCVDNQMNRNVISLFLIQMLMCFVSSIIAVRWDDSAWWYMSPLTTAAWISLFLTYFILLNTLIPASLWVSVEILKFIQSYFMEYHGTVRCNSKNTHEELGQITHVFSDKTGTLTVNKMKFVGCSVAGKMYLIPSDEDKQHSPPVIAFPGVIPPSDNLVRVLRDAVSEQSDECMLFFALAVCHTCERLGGDANQSSSPDEAALVQMAGEVGVEFLGRPGSKTISVKMPDVVEYEVLFEVPFTSERRMMTVVVRQVGAGPVFIVSKGADSTVIPKCVSGPIAETKSVISTFSAYGFRTLCVAVLRVENDDWEKKFAPVIGDSARVSEANELVESAGLSLVGCTAVEDRLQEGVPETLRALKAAGIKVCMITGDKQETAINIARSCGLISSKKNVFAMLSHSHLYGGGNFVPLRCLQDIASGNVDVGGVIGRELWDLATNGGTIRRGSRVPTPPVLQRELTNPDCESVRKGQFSLVIDGESLQNVLASPSSAQHLVDVLVFEQCEAVVFCRVSPKQKGEIVRLVKLFLASHRASKNKQSTLAIGDGANDVNMINVANVGVGIAGQEGSQAANAADYAIEKFADLYPLIMNHGRWNYRRTTTFICLFMYKNFIFTCCQMWFAILAAFSAQTVFDDAYVLLFNSIFCIIPLFLFGVLDKDIHPQNDAPGGTNSVVHPPDMTLSYWKEVIIPAVYKEVGKFSEVKMLSWCFAGAAQSVILMFGTWGAWMYTNSALDNEAGRNASFWMASITLYTQIILLVTAVNLLVAKEWTKLFVVCLVLFNIALYFGFVFVYDVIDFRQTDYVHGIANDILGNTQFWFICIVNLTVCILPVAAFSIIMKLVSPKWTSLADNIRIHRKTSPHPSPSSSSLIQP